MAQIKRQRVGMWARRRTMASLAVAFTAEECDKTLLTNMYLAIGNTLHALPSQLGQLTMYRALTQVCAPYLPQRACPGAAQLCAQVPLRGFHACKQLCAEASHLAGVAGDALLSKSGPEIST